MKHLLYLTATLFLLVACDEWVKKPATPFSKGQTLSISSQPLNNYGRSNARKIHVREEVDKAGVVVCDGDESFLTRLLWDEGDQIDLFVDDDATTHAGHAYPQAVFTLISGADTDEATFNGTMPADGDHYAIMYPHRDAGDEATKTIVEDATTGNLFPYKVTQFNMPAVQDYRSPDGNTYESKKWPTFASQLLPIFGKGTLDEGFDSYPCGGVLRFQLWSDKKGGETVQSIRLATPGGETLSGSFMITPTTSGSLEMNMSPKSEGTGRSAVIVRMPTGFTMPTTQAEAVWIYFVLPAPLTLSKGFLVYTYAVEETNPMSPTATPTHYFKTPDTADGKIVIKQNHITTVEFDNTDAKGNNGNINGGGWQH